MPLARVPSVRGPGDRSTSPVGAARVGAACAVVAGLIHVWVAPGHAEAAAPIGAFFLGVAMGQLALGLLLATRPLTVAQTLGALAVHVVLVGLYVATRTADLPFVPPHGHDGGVMSPPPGGIGNGVPIYPGARIEHVGVLDLTCVVAELILVVVLLERLPARRRALVLNVLAATAAVGVGLRLLG